jgi:hypothetical protein
MTSIDLVCSTCNARLTISRNAPQQLICRSCLARVHNRGSEIGVLVFAMMTLLILTILAIFKNHAIARPNAPSTRSCAPSAAMAVLVIFGIWLLIFGLCAVVFIGANVGAKFTR